MGGYDDSYYDGYNNGINYGYKAALKTLEDLIKEEMKTATWSLSGFNKVLKMIEKLKKEDVDNE